MPGFKIQTAQAPAIMGIWGQSQYVGAFALSASHIKNMFFKVH